MAKQKQRRSSSALYLDDAALPPDVFSPQLMNSFSRTAVGGENVSRRKNKQTEGKKKEKRRDGKWAGRRGRDGGGQRRGDNSANGTAVWIFSRSRNGDYDLAISVTRFY